VFSHADAELVRRDQALPGLRVLLDTGALTARLGVELAPAALGRVVATDVRYKPGTSCLVAYLLELDGRSRYGYAKAYGPAAPVKLAKRRAQRRDRVVLDDLAIVVQLFPDDHRLRSLRRLVEPCAARRLAARLAPDRPCLREAELTAVRYKPERRYVARLQAQSGERAALRLYADGGFEPARSAASAFRSAGALSVPGLLGSSARDRALLLEWVPGRSLEEVLAEPRLDPTAAARVGTALALLHEQQPAALTTPAPLAGAAAVHAAAGGLAALLPSLGERADALGNRLLGRLARLPALRSTIHGDFSADQVLLAAGRAAILDLDRAGLGHPAADLGSFVAALERDALDGTLERSRVDAFAGELVAAYRDRSGCAALPVELHTAAALLRLAVEPFRRREPDWPGRAERLLARAEELEGRSRRPGRRARAGTPALAELARLWLPGGERASLGLPARALQLRRAWPRAQSELVLEYAAGETVVAAQWLADGAKREEIARTTGCPVVSAAGGAKVLLHARGADRRLPGLAPLLARPGATLVSHRAERRAVVRLDDGSGLRYAKVVRPERLDGIVAAGRTAERLAGAGFRAPLLLAVDPPAGVSVWSALHGSTLHELAGTPAFATAAGAAGAALRSLHDAASPGPLQPHPPEEEARCLRSWLDRLAGFAPGLAEAVRRPAEVLSARLAAGAGEPVVLHRDFHDKQVVRDPAGQVGFLDFDTLALGEAAVDLANLLVHLELRLLQGRLPVAQARGAAASFLDGYEPTREAWHRCGVHADSARLRLACLYAFRPGSGPVCRGLLERVGEAPLGPGSPGSPAPSMRTFSAPSHSHVT